MYMKYDGISYRIPFEEMNKFNYQVILMNRLKGYESLILYEVKFYLQYYKYIDCEYEYF